MTTTKGPKRLRAEWDAHAKAWSAKAAREAGYVTRPVTTWGICETRGKTSATYPASPLPHNEMGGEPGVCAWCLCRREDAK